MDQKQSIREMEKKLEREEDVQDTIQRQHQPPNISPMEPLTRGAYGGGMYRTEGGGEPEKRTKPPASETQSAD